LLVFYPGDFTPVCTKQLCEYRDHFDHFIKLGIQIIGISKNTPEEHAAFKKQYGFQFPLLSDPENVVAKEYKCGSKWMFGAVSRANVIVDQNQNIVYRYVEKLPITRRKADEMQEILLSLQLRR
jgi:peroxiredoxin Q/BCP